MQSSPFRAYFLSLGNCRVSRLGGRGRGFEVEVEVNQRSQRDDS